MLSETITLPDLSQYAPIFNIVLIVIFALLIIFLVVAIIRGIFKGFFKSTYQLIMIGILIIVACCTLTAVTNAVGAIDLSGISKYIIIKNQSGQSIAVLVTNLFDTLRDSIAATLILYGMEGTAIEIAQLATSLAKVFVVTGVLICEVFIILILGNLLISLLWHILFKHFIPKAARKGFKIRWLSSIEEGVKYCVVALMLIMPFSSLANIVNQSYQKLSEDQKNTELMKNIGSFVDTYNNSLLAQTLFNWTYNEQTGLTFDSSFISYITQSDVTVNEFETVSATELFQTLSDVAMNVLSVDTSGAAGTALVDLISGDTLVTIFSSFSKYKFFSYLLPVGVSVAMAYAGNNLGVTVENVDFENVDWTHETTTLEYILVDLVNSGAFDKMIEATGNKQTYDPTLLVDEILNDHSYGYVRRALGMIDSSQTLRNVIPVCMSYLAKEVPDIGQYLPVSYQECRNISWGNELNVLYDSLFRINKISPELTDALIGKAKGQTNPDATTPSEAFNAQTVSTNKLIRRATEEEKTSDHELFDIILENIETFKTIFLGEFDSEGNLMHVDSDGYVYKNANNMIPLFDLTIVNRVTGSLFDKLIEMVKEQLASPESTIELDTDELKSLITNEILGDHYVKNCKEEFGSIFDVLKEFDENKVLDSVKKLSEGDIESISKKEANDMADSLELVDRTTILPFVFKEVMKNTLSDMEELKDLGIEFDEQNVDNVENIGEEAGDLIRALPSFSKIKEIYVENTEGSKEMDFRMVEKYYIDIAVVLDTVYRSDLVNPKTGDDDNNNFVILLENMLGRMSEDVNGISYKNEMVAALRAGQEWANDVTPSGDYPRDRFGRPILTGEIGDMINVLRYFAKECTNPGANQGKTLFEVFSEAQSDPNKNFADIIGSLEKDFKISKFFASVERSAVFKATIGDFLDENLNDPEIGLIDEGRSFNNVTNWEEEGLRFANLCNSIDEAQIDLNNFDITTFDDFEGLNKMLHSLADSAIFKDYDSDNVANSTTFNRFVYGKLSEDPEMRKLLKDDDLTEGLTEADYTFVKSKMDFEVSKVEGDQTIDIHAIKHDWCSKDWIEKYMNVPGPTSPEHITTPGFYDDYYSLDQITKIVDVLKNIDAMNKEMESGGDQTGDNISSFNVKPETMNAVLDSLNESKPFRMVLYNSIVKMFENAEITLFDFKCANYEWLAKDTYEGFIDPKDARSVEIDYIMNVYTNYYKHFAKLTEAERDLVTIIKTPQNIVYLNDMLVNFNNSDIFHHAGPRANQKGDNKYTFFHDLVETIFEEADFGKFYFRIDANHHSSDYIAANPVPIEGKPTPTPLYTNYPEKIKYFTRDVLFDWEDRNGEGSEKTQEENINDLLEVISTVTGGPKDVANVPFDKDGNAILEEDPLHPGKYLNCYMGILDENGEAQTDVNKIDVAALTDIFTEMNACTMFETAVPNLVDYMLEESIKAEEETSAMKKICVSADPYYCYWQNDGGYKGKFSYDKYTDEDISLLSATIDNSKKLNDFLKTHDLTKILDQNEISAEDFEKFMTLFRSTLDDLNDSNLFHRFKVTYRTSVPEDARKDLTSFEEILRKLYVDTTLDKIVFNDKVDNPIYGKGENKTDLKIITQIAMESILDVDKVNPVNTGSEWDSEIANIFDFMYLARDLDIGTFDSGFSSVFAADTKLSPQKLDKTLFQLNGLNTAQGAVSHLLWETIGQTQLADFATYKTIDYTNYYLTKDEFSTHGGLDTFVVFLDEMANYKMSGDSYIDAQGQIIDPNDPELFNKKVFVSYDIPEGADAKTAITNFIGTSENPKKSVSTILNFIEDSKMYDELILIDNGLEGVDKAQSNIITSSLVTYNIFEADINKYILGTNDFEKMQTMDHILNLEKYSPDADGNAIDTLLREDFLNASFNPNEIKNVSSIKSQISKIFYALNHENGDPTNPIRTRAYVASEVFAGVIDELVQAEISLANTTYVSNPKLQINPNNILLRSNCDPINPTRVTKPSDIKEHTYDLLNDYEARGLEGILGFYESVDAFNAAIGGTTDPAIIIAELNKMSLSIKTNFALLEYEDGVGSGNYKNSRLSTLIYLSRAHETITPFNIIPINCEDLTLVYDQIPDVPVTSVEYLLWAKAHPNTALLHNQYPTAPEGASSLKDSYILIDSSDALFLHGQTNPGISTYGFKGYGDSLEKTLQFFAFTTMYNNAFNELFPGGLI